MIIPLFPPEVSKAPIVSSIPKCGACGLHKTCITPKMPVSGSGRKGILVVGEAPGAEEDDQGTQFVGKSGRFLRTALAEVGIDLDRDCWKTNTLICRPPDNKTPTPAEIDYCRPNLKTTIEQFRPRHIMLFGLPAVRSLIGPYWREDVGAMAVWAGWQIPFQPFNCWVTPNYHPSYVLRSEEDRNGAAVRVWFGRYLKWFARLDDRPWGAVPDYERDIQIVVDADAAAQWIRQKMIAGGAFSVDYETDRLKPDCADARIVCCSVCWEGRETIAYPWVGDAIAATGELLRSVHPKIAANGKFEDRWTRRFFGFPVCNSKWDVVLSAHHLDNREGITSVKFQAFVRCGFPDWSYSIKSFLEGDGGNGKNRIHEVDLRKLLLYCGLDSLIQYHIAVKQREELKNYAF